MEPDGTEKASKTMDNLGIIAAGGPAPGINGVISSATIEARNRGRKVIGILDGFKWISRGDTSKILNLDIQNTSRIYTTGGSIIGVSRENPCLLYTSPSPRDRTRSRMPSSA